MCEVKTGDLSRGKTIQAGMRTHKIEEENKHRDEIISRIKRIEALFGFVPSLELFMKALNKIVGNIVLEALYSNMFNIVENRFNGYFVGSIAVRNNRIGLTRLLSLI